MADSQYSYMVDAILGYYSSGSDIWQRVNAGTASAGEVFNAFSYIPQVQVDRGIGGNVLGVSYAEPLSKLQVVASEQDIIDSINSNSMGGQFGGGRGFNGNIPANFSQDATTGDVIIRSGSKSSLGATLSTIADRASLAVTGVNIGCKLGKFIDQTLYNINPDWWDRVLPTINPATWTSLCGQSEVGDFFMRVLFDVTPEGTTGYISEEVLAYYYQMMRDSGVFNDGQGESTVTPDPDVGQSLQANWSGLSLNLSLSSTYLQATGSYGHTYTWTVTSGTCYMLWGNQSGNYNYPVFISIGNSPFTIHWIEFKGTTVFNEGDYTSRYFDDVDGCAQWDSVYFWDSQVEVGPINVIPSSGLVNWTIQKDIIRIIKTGTIEQETGVEGISDIPNATQYPPTNITGTTTQQVLNELKQQYPDLFTDAITETTMQEDGTLDEKTYVPIPWAVDDIRDDTATTTDTATQDNTIVDPQTMEKVLDDNTGPTTPDTGDGNGPSPIVPTGNASSLWAVYHPSQSILNSFGSWLWSSDLVEQIKRLFFDPMQGVIGVHKVFAPVPTGGSQNIKVGYIDSGISCPTVSSQYTEIDCGTVRVDEFFGNVLDYEPFTQISAYLPFIGVVKLSTSDVMRGQVNIKYGVDVITGACLAKIKITRDGNGGILYSFGGSCAVHYPLSSGSYSGIISGIVSAAVGIGTSIATGNPLAAVGGVVSGAHQARFDVSKSGGFTGASGATGPKIPYLIISRPQSAMARNFDLMTGYPANNTVQVGDCDGYIKCREVHIESATATKDEKTMIEDLLKSGILI